MFVQKYCWQKICICDILREKLNLGVTHQINIALRYFFTLQTYIWPKIHSKLEPSWTRGPTGSYRSNRFKAGPDNALGHFYEPLKSKQEIST